MKYIVALMLVAMAALASGESVKMMELSPAIGSGSECEVALWCRDYATAARCGKVAYCRQWIWEDTMDTMDAEDNTTCDKCKAFVEEVLSKNVTYIHDLCELIPFGALEKECEKLIEAAIAGETPLKICQIAKICPKSQVRKMESDANMCTLCKTMVKWIEAHPDDDKTALDDICNLIAGAVKDECKLLVDALIEAMKTTNETTVCKAVHACTNASRPFLLGSDPCTQGPSYWCASPGNAKECAALEYCQKKYRL